MIVRSVIFFESKWNVVEFSRAHLTRQPFDSYFGVKLFNYFILPTRKEKRKRNPAIFQSPSSGIIPWVPKRGRAGGDLLLAVLQKHPKRKWRGENTIQIDQLSCDFRTGFEHLLAVLQVHGFSPDRLNEALENPRIGKSRPPASFCEHFRVNPKNWV